MAAVLVLARRREAACPAAPSPARLRSSAAASEKDTVPALWRGGGRARVVLMTLSAEAGSSLTRANTRGRTCARLVVAHVLCSTYRFTAG